MKKLTYLFIFIFINLSCSKEKIEVPGSSENSLNGILSFKDSEEFFSVIDSLSKLPLSDSKGYKSEEGFLSLLTIQENYYECLDNATDQVIHDNIIMNHKPFLKDNSISEFKIQNKIVYPVINKDGIVMVGNQIYKFTEDGQIIVKSKNVEQALSITTENKENDTIKVFKYSSFQSSKSIPCYSYQTTGLIYNGSDRRCLLTSTFNITFGDMGNGTYYYDSYVMNEGIAEKKGLFGWKTYNTVHWMDVNYQATLNNGYTKTTTESKTNSNSYHLLFIDHIQVGYWYEQDDYAHLGYFDWINCNVYTHQGMAGVTAEICCPII